MPFRLAIYGYDTALGKLSLECMESESALRPDELLPLTPLSGEYDAVTLGGSNYFVQNIDEFDFSLVDAALFMCTPDETVRHESRVRQSGCVLIDGSGFYADSSQVPLLLPALNPGEIDKVVECRICQPPVSSAIMLSLILSPLVVELGVKRCGAVLLQAASEFGEGGPESLLHETMALLNGQDPEQALFEAQLSFNLHLGSGLQDGDGPDKEAAQESRIAAQVTRLIGALPSGLQVSVVQVPVLYGHSAVLEVELEEQSTVEELREILGESRYLSLHKEVMLTPVTTAVNSNKVSIGRIRAGAPGGRHFLVEAVFDNLRCGTASTCVEIARLLRGR
ncbi:MAG: hypothetical protein IJ228_10485 [Succinivibrio sp.]|nr:hypothetical protein [Succinivibrio sp.]